MPTTLRMPPCVRTFVVLPLLLLAMLFTTALVETPQAEAKSKSMSRSQRIKSGYQVATRQMGDPYSYGAAGPKAFDCSGLLYYSYRKAGFKKMPRTSGAQHSFVRNIAKRNLRRGDFVFFHNKGRVYHAAIFVGRKNGRVEILSAPRTGTRVRREMAWTSSFYAGTLRGM